MTKFNVNLALTRELDRIAAENESTLPPHMINQNVKKDITEIKQLKKEIASQQQLDMLYQYTNAASTLQGNKLILSTRTNSSQQTQISCSIYSPTNDYNS